MDTPTGATGFGTTTGSDSGMESVGERSASGRESVCPTCGQSTNKGLEQFLGRLGISDDMIDNIKSSMQNVDVEQYLDTARNYLKNSGSKATTYAKENPGKVAAGVAALAVGAGLLLNAMNRE